MYTIITLYKSKINQYNNNKKILYINIYISMPKRKRKHHFQHCILLYQFTEAECLQRGLFGGPASLSNQKVEKILPGTHCYYTIQKVRSYKVRFMLRLKLVIMSIMHGEFSCTSLYIQK